MASPPGSVQPRDHGGASDAHGWHREVQRSARGVCREVHHVVGVDSPSQRRARPYCWGMLSALDGGGRCMRCREERVAGGTVVRGVVGGRAGAGSPEAVHGITRAQLLAEAGQRAGRIE